MKRSLLTLERLQLQLASDSAATRDVRSSSTTTTAEGRRAAEAAKEQRLAKLTPYKQAEYRCVECVADLRRALRDVEELEMALGRGNRSCIGFSREDEEAGEAFDAGEDEHAKLLSRRAECQGPSRPTDTALLEHELARSRQLARRAHHRLQHLQREAARLAAAASATAPSVTSAAAVADGGDVSAPPAATEMRDWQRALQHVERAKQWYRHVFDIHVVSSADDPMLQLNRPAQSRQSAGSMTHFGRVSNVAPPSATSALALSSSSEYRRSCERAAASAGSPPLLLQSARDDAVFQEFFSSVQEGDALIDAAIDRLTDGVGRLLDTARGMQDELAVQDTLLEQTGARAEANEAQLLQLNRRLYRAMREMEDSSICMYVVCLLVLLLVVGLLLRVAM
ncbi:hypothetical protein LSCM1_07990 [Leishmania martiniquensis]|uniref:Uncharacterized protein n=1 Tax=Leishmania martiniquensis TaxID=1580590 RepID=A0A836H4K5_9TRYP|nr:hypothetical protein LSCM1_07990 [Leishmania martiniquensis]